MKTVQRATAGTLESSDVLVEVEPCSGIVIEIESAVLPQFGDAIEGSVRDVLRALGVTDARLHLMDRGALDCTLRARVEAAVRRAMRAEGGGR